MIVAVEVETTVATFAMMRVCRFALVVIVVRRRTTGAQTGIALSAAAASFNRARFEGAGIA